DQFPGLVYQIDGPDTTLILFESGKIVCTGARKLEDATTSINTIKNKLSSMGVS
ncbi:MAG: TATA-box-binding protein, partial [Candidatus Thermoplasmatota archaeon]|nr:TATA-box-binding protein [Candidatus Thermoplasmatota archaeon]